MVSARACALLEVTQTSGPANVMNYIVPGEAANMFRILRIIIDEYGFDGDRGRGCLQRRLDYEKLLKAFEEASQYARNATGQYSEFTEYRLDGSCAVGRGD